MAGKRVLTSSQMVQLNIPLLRYTDVSVNDLEPDGQSMVLDFTAVAIKGATGICQIRSNNAAQATSYLL